MLSIRRTSIWISLPFVLVSALVLSSCRTTSPKAASPTLEAAQVTKHQIVAFAFDWDDNIFNMPTQIMLKDKHGKEKGMSTAEFAIIRESVGKKGTPWADYQVDSSLTTGSLRFFGDLSSDHINHFQADIDKAMSSSKTAWQGPAWQSFVQAMSRPETAAATAIITARLHEPATIQNALKTLVSRGYIQNVPSQENIWAVNAPSFPATYKKVYGVDSPDGGAANPSLRKSKVMENILDRINAQPLGQRAITLIDAEGTSKKPLHVWGFSDDDFGNFATAADVLQKSVDQGRWPNIKITLYFTGTNNPHEKPRAVVLRPKQKPRPFTEAESIEWTQINKR